MRRILVLSPHIDDGILGAGGSIPYFIGRGDEIYYTLFSLSTQTIAPAVATAEVTKAAHVLGIPVNNIKIYRYPTRDFPRQRQGILENLVEMRGQVDIVLTPNTFDIHQDHATVTREAMRAFKHTCILGYELPWNNIDFEAAGFIQLEEPDVALKTSALEYFESQKDRPYMQGDLIRSLARVRGAQMGWDYAESFEVIRWIVK